MGISSDGDCSAVVHIAAVCNYCIRNAVHRTLDGHTAAGNILCDGHRWFFGDGHRDFRIRRKALQTGGGSITVHVPAPVHHIIGIVQSQGKVHRHIGGLVRPACECHTVADCRERRIGLLRGLSFAHLNLPREGEVLGGCYHSTDIQVFILRVVNRQSVLAAGAGNCSPVHSICAGLPLPHCVVVTGGKVLKPHGDGAVRRDVLQSQRALTIQLVCTGPCVNLSIHSPALHHVAALRLCREAYIRTVAHACTGFQRIAAAVCRSNCSAVFPVCIKINPVAVVGKRDLHMERVGVRVLIAAEVDGQRLAAVFKLGYSESVSSSV